jgi:hypothetical protein
MVPLGLALLSDDLPWLKVPLETLARWIERLWHRIHAHSSQRGKTARWRLIHPGRGNRCGGMPLAVRLPKIARAVIAQAAMAVRA